MIYNFKNDTLFFNRYLKTNLDAHQVIARRR